MHEIFPSVKQCIVKEGFFLIPNLPSCVFPNELALLKPKLKEALCVKRLRSDDKLIRFSPSADLPKEGYRLHILTNQIVIDYADYAGAFYAIQTLGQLRNPTSKSLDCVEITDFPDLSIRGAMLDISRSKIPTLATLKQAVDLLAAVKINHLELYVEGFSFEYRSFPQVNEGTTPLLVEEFIELERYAKTRAIDLVPNQNGFGHMSAWLKRPEYHALAETPDGILLWGYPFPASTLAPNEPGSLALVKAMMDDMLPHSQSPYFNMNCDEPFELGQGKSKTLCETIGMGNVYVDFVAQLADHVRSYHKRPLIWGDVLIHHPEVLPKLPSDMIFLDWGYDRDYPFAEHGTLLEKQHVSFVTCPGTSSWNSFASREIDMLQTTENAVRSAKQHKGLGLITTDWGDFGHLQYWPFSYLGLLSAASAAWCGETNLPAVISYLDLVVFRDETVSVGTLLHRLALISDLETSYVYNGSQSFKSIMFVDTDLLHPMALKQAILFGELRKAPLAIADFQRILIVLNEVRNDCTTILDSVLRDEIVQTADMIEMACRVNLYANGVATADPKRILSLLDKIIPTHERLWLSRNKSGGFTESVSRLVNLRAIIAVS